MCIIIGLINLVAGSNIFGQAHNHSEMVTWVMIGLTTVVMGMGMWWAAGKL